MFQLKPYFAPDFTQERFVSAPNAVLAPAPSTAWLLSNIMP
jgi:hypothetical protein